MRSQQAWLLPGAASDHGSERNSDLQLGGISGAVGLNDDTNHELLKHGGVYRTCANTQRAVLRRALLAQLRRGLGTFFSERQGADRVLRLLQCRPQDAR